MNRITLFCLCVLLTASGALAQDIASVWADKNKEALAAVINDDAHAALLKQGAPALAVLFAEVKTGYASDPVALTRIGALTQYVMHPAGVASRAAYADALTAAAQRAADADVTCFFLDQLRWCGLPQHADAIKSIGKSDKPGVATLATIAALAVADDQTLQAAPAKPTRYAALNAELAKLPPDALTPRLLAAFDDPDPAFAAIALTHARTAGGASETRQWAAKLTATADPVRKTMLLDMLAARADNAAQGAVAAHLADPDNRVAAAAHQAFLRLDTSAYAAHIPALLKRLPPEQLATVRDGLRQLPTALLRTALLHAYPAFSATGKLLALELLKERRVTEATPLAIAALDAQDAETAIAGWRLLRETAGKDHAAPLTAKLLATAGCVTPEAQTTLASAARRDASGAYAAALTQAIEFSSDAQKPLALETAARLGGAPLLKTVEAAASSPNADTALAAVRALALWPDTTALPALLRQAVASPDARRQTLAMRGVEKMFNAHPVDRASLLPAWRAIRAQPGNDEHKKAIDDLFKETVNVALNKPVTTDAPTEGNHVPANLVDGTLEKAWHAGQSPSQAQIDLGTVHSVDSTHITFYHADGRTYTFKLELSPDGTAWQEVASNLADPRPATAEGLRLTFPPIPARYARLTVIKNSANFAIHVLELKLFSTLQP